MADQTWKVSDLIAQLRPDPWRLKTHFSPDMENCHRVLFDHGSSRGEKADALAEWLSKNQPCHFGNMEAKQKRLAFCILTENDLEQNDQEIRKRIHADRLEWKRVALTGKSHGFLIVAVSERIARARRGTHLHKLAECICDLYLGVPKSDEIHHDELMLEIMKNADEVERRRWKVGVNYFSSHGDGLWWHDHRIPGGIAFSMNSVGHMARTQAEIALTRNPNMLASSDVPREKLVYWALRNAMKTIGAPLSASNRGTWLAEHGSCPEDNEPPTFELRQEYLRDLAGYSVNRYHGRYHTDHTIPSAYFDEGLWKLEEIGVRKDLFFNYLHNYTESDYKSMGIGDVIDSENKGEQVNEDLRSEQ